MLDESLYTIETPENIDVAFDIAGIGSRFLAALIDHVIIGVVLALSCTGIALVANSLELGLDENIILGLFGLGIYLALCGYYIFFETVWNGQTPGKRMIGLRMVRVGGRPIGFVGSAVRNVIRLADFLPVLYGLGVLVMFIDKRARRLGDLAAGCIAVREQKAVTLESLGTPTPAEMPVVADAAALTIPNIHVLKRDDYDVVQEFLRRSPSISMDARQRLARQLIDGLQQRLGYPVQARTQAEAETFLRMVAAEYQALQRIDRSGTGS